MSEIKLLPCPFCGGEVRLISFDTEDGESFCVNYEDELEADYSYVHCFNCDADFMPNTGIAREVLKAWNTRKPMQEICERLEPYMVDIRNTNQLFNGSGAFHTAIKIVKEVGGMNG